MFNLSLWEDAQELLTNKESFNPTVIKLISQFVEETE